MMWLVYGLIAFFAVCYGGLIAWTLWERRHIRRRKRALKRRAQYVARLREMANEDRPKP